MKAGAFLLVTAMAACGSSSGGDDDGVDGGGGDGVDAGSAIVIQGLSPRLEASYVCDVDGSGPGGNGPCANYHISLSITNRTVRDITRVDEVEIDIGGVTLSPITPLTCGTTPWIAAAGENSGVIDIDLYWYYDAGPTLRYDCPVDPERESVYYYGEMMPPAPTGGSLTVRVSGILDDATPWTAERAAPIAN